MGINFRELAQYTYSTSKTFANHSHSRKMRRLNTREHFWIYSSKIVWLKTPD